MEILYYVLVEMNMPAYPQGYVIATEIATLAICEHLANVHVSLTDGLGEAICIPGGTF